MGGWDGAGIEMVQERDAPMNFVGEIRMGEKEEAFRILNFKRTDKTIFPSRQDCTQQQAHEVQGPGEVGKDEKGNPMNWCIGRANADRARIGDTFLVTYNIEDSRVFWKKKT